MELRKDLTLKRTEVRNDGFSQVGTCVAIVVICYLSGIGAKLIPVIKDNYIPVVVGIVGGILGVVGMYVIPDFPAMMC